MRYVQQWMPAVLSLALGACADLQTAPQGESAEQQTAALSTERSDRAEEIFLIKRDMKKCAAPRCGGFYLTRPNHADLTCVDGKRAKECYVSGLEFSNGLQADDGDLVRGTIQPRKFAELNLTFGVLKASAAFAPVAKTLNTTGYYYAPYDTGIRCIRNPCNSMGVLAVNTELSGALVSVSFARKDVKENAAIEAAFFNGLGSNIQIAKDGQSNLVFGAFRSKYDAFARQWVKDLAVTNVYTPKTVPHRQCVVHEEGSTVIAWNVGSDADAQALVANLGNTVTMHEGTCADVQTFCTMLYRPVHGVIDALGEACQQQSNACGFKGAVINAAGVEGKAGGTFSDGKCDSNLSCESDDDCEDGFCGFTASEARVCRPWAQEGEHCQGFVTPENFRQCRPDLTCKLSEPTGDAGGICSGK